MKTQRDPGSDLFRGMLPEDSPLLVANQKKALVVLADYAKRHQIDRDETVDLIKMLGLGRHVARSLTLPA